MSATKEEEPKEQNDGSRHSKKEIDATTTEKVVKRKDQGLKQYSHGKINANEINSDEIGDLEKIVSEGKENFLGDFEENRDKVIPATENNDIFHVTSDEILLDVGSKTSRVKSEESELEESVNDAETETFKETNDSVFLFESAIKSSTESLDATVPPVSLTPPPTASPTSSTPSPPTLPTTPPPSLFSPSAFGTSTPRARLSSTPCPLSNSTSADGPLSLPTPTSGSKSYDYLLKVLLVGDSDVGKQEIITGMEDGSLDSPYCSSTGAAYKTTIILIEGKKVKLHIWDTSGQGRFCTIIRSYSRGAQGILLVYDITNRWSFEGIDRWVREVEEHAPGIPKVLVGNRLHLAFKRQVDPAEAELYAERHNMGFYEISPLVNFNITESFQELCRMALKRNGMERLWRSNRVLSLHELCCHAIVARTSGYGIEKLPLPDAIKANLKSYALTSYPVNRQNYKTLTKERKKRIRPPDSTRSNCANVSRKSCAIA